MDRETKKRETRQRISDVATSLFCTRGFEVVTLDDIARGASVSKMTVSNYFPRKEDLMLDRTDELLFLPLRSALRARPEGHSPANVLEAFVAEMRKKERPLGRIDERWVTWWRVVLASPALKARLHEVEEEAAEGLAAVLSTPKTEAVARLMGGMIVLTVRTARQEALAAFERGGSVKKANATFLAVVERGFEAIRALAS